MITLIILIWIHFIADFILQTDEMALNKSSSNKCLAIHVLVYTFCFLPFGPLFMLATYLCHFITDYVSSRITKKLWAEQKRHIFFVVIGADQALHLTALILALRYLV